MFPHKPPLLPSKMLPNRLPRKSPFHWISRRPTGWLPAGTTSRPCGFSRPGIGNTRPAGRSSFPNSTCWRRESTSNPRSTIDLPTPWSLETGWKTIAKQYHVPWQYLAKLNRVDPEKIRPGQKLKVIEGPFGVVIDQQEYLLTVHAHGYYVAAFPIGIETDGKTPTGTFHVKDKLADPTYYGPDGTIAHDDPNNPLGEFWIEINDEQRSLTGIGIHGTIEPESVGTAASQGCVRLRDQDIAALFDLLSVGSEVVIRR